LAKLTSNARATRDCEAQKCAFSIRLGGEIAGTPILICEFPCGALPLSGAAPEDALLGELSVAIYRLMRRDVFEPEDVCLLASVYEEVVKTLGLEDEKDALKLLVARKLIALAQAGERDPECLRELTIEAVERERLSLLPGSV
jgi:hypothetical protein